MTGVHSVRSFCPRCPCNFNIRGVQHKRNGCCRASNQSQVTRGPTLISPAVPALSHVGLRTRTVPVDANNHCSLLNIPIPRLNPTFLVHIYLSILTFFLCFDLTRLFLLSRQNDTGDDAGIITAAHGDSRTTEDPQDRRLTLAFANLNRE